MGLILKGPGTWPPRVPPPEAPSCRRFGMTEKQKPLQPRLQVEVNGWTKGRFGYVDIWEFPKIGVPPNHPF